MSVNSRQAVSLSLNHGINSFRLIFKAHIHDSASTFLAMFSSHHATLPPTLWTSHCKPSDTLQVPSLQLSAVRHPRVRSFLFLRTASRAGTDPGGARWGYGPPHGGIFCKEALQIFWKNCKETLQISVWPPLEFGCLCLPHPPFHGSWVRPCSRVHFCPG